MWVKVSQMRELPANPASPEGAAAQQAPAKTTERPRLGAAVRGSRGRVIGIEICPARTGDDFDPAELERRLLEMGFVEGAQFEVLHEGPIGRDPIAIKLDDSRVALRRRDANALIVETEDA